MPTNTKQQLCIKPTGFLVDNGTNQFTDSILTGVVCSKSILTVKNLVICGQKFISPFVDYLFSIFDIHISREMGL